MSILAILVFYSSIVASQRTFLGADYQLQSRCQYMIGPNFYDFRPLAAVPVLNISTTMFGEFEDTVYYSFCRNIDNVTLTDLGCPTTQPT